MENAAKALLIASGVLVGIIIISMIMFSYRQISDYYNSKDQAKEFETLSAFNEQYIPYNRDNVRGSDIVSLTNKIIDFNTLKEEEPITIEIKIATEVYKSEADSFYYMGKPSDNTKILVDIDKIYSSNPKLALGQVNLQNMLNEAMSIESKYSYGIATKLAANISTLMGNNSRKTSAELLKELKVNQSEYGGLVAIQDDIYKYYQYNQFKRAHFNCTELSYTQNGRVKSFKFEFNGKIE